MTSYRSRETVEAYYRDGTPEADSAIIQAIPGSELLADTFGEVRLMVPGALLGNCKMPVGSWIHNDYRIWTITRDDMFRRMWEVPQNAENPPQPEG